ncbi:MAG: ABC transporter substrate-binding protein [Acidobacteria bacterium]|nr:ABC transporter substrate-binding protein [Acidobacteriota bacterium]
MIIESSPANLDPRVGTDAQSERIGKLIFDALLRRDEHFNLQPALAESWDIPDPLTYVFHLRQGVKFSDGRPLTSRDVKWTMDTIRNGSIITPKASTFRFVQAVEARDEYTVVFHLSEPYATLLWNLSDGAIGIVPFGSGADFNRQPVGSGPFRLVSMAQDKQVVLERNPNYWGEAAHVPRLRFAVVPDTTTRALELRKGSADVEINALTADMVATIEQRHQLAVERAPGTIYAYLAFNLRDPLLKDVRVRQALAYAIDRRPIIHYLWRDMARPAASVLPPQHWAYDANVQTYDYDPARARQILDAAGYAAKNGVRFHLTMKTSTEESTRLLAMALQQQLRDVGIALEVRTFEFATFYSDVQKGAFQLYSLRWIGGNEDPDIFEHVFYSTSTPPRRANRSYYANPRVDQLIDEARRTVDEQRRKELYGEIQEVIAKDLPYINLWYFDNVAVHTARVKNIELSPSGNYDFLQKAELVQ